MHAFEAGDVVRYLGSFEGFTNLRLPPTRPDEIGIILEEMSADGVAPPHALDEDLERCRTKYYRVWFNDGSIGYVSDMDIEPLDELGT